MMHRNDCLSDIMASNVAMKKEAIQILKTALSQGCGLKMSKGPSEAQIKEKWDRCIEGVVVRSSVGTVLGGLASLILFRMNWCCA